MLKVWCCTFPYLTHWAAESHLSQILRNHFLMTCNCGKVKTSINSFLYFFLKKKEERTYRKQIKLCNLLCKFTIELFQIFSGMLNYAPQGEIAKIHQSKNLSLAKVERNRNYMSKTHQQHNEKAPLRLFEQYRTLDNSWAWSTCYNSSSSSLGRK